MPIATQQTILDDEILQAKLRFGIVGNAPALIEAIGRALRVAPIDLSVLIQGESGSGKEFFPRIIHAYSPRKHAKYIAVNCGAIPEGTIDSELFGHEKGAFTGALATRKGYFEEADGGTIFLDEVAELPLTTQARLLRVLESGEFLKVGSSTVQHTNLRVVAATNVDMLKAVREGRFREDLYYRLSTVTIDVPPLRARGNDIILLARRFASTFAERYTMPPVTIEEEATRRLLLHYRWPGNVRQLKNVIEQMALFEAGKNITPEILRRYLPADAADSYTPAVHSDPDRTSYSREREMLFNLIFSLQHEIASLRSRLDSIDPDASPADRSASDSTTDPRRHSLVKIHPSHIPDILSHAPSSAHVASPAVDDAESLDFTPVEEVSTESTSPSPADPMTLEQTERETIRRALERNSGRRKAAAAELNISERTLYRKIRDFGLE